MFNLHIRLYSCSFDLVAQGRHPLRHSFLTFGPEFHMYTCMRVFAMLIASHHTVKMHDVTAKHSTVQSISATRQNKIAYFIHLPAQKRARVVLRNFHWGSYWKCHRISPFAPNFHFLIVQKSIRNKVLVKEYTLLIFQCDRTVPARNNVFWNRQGLPDTNSQLNRFPRVHRTVIILAYLPKILVSQEARSREHGKCAWIVVLSLTAVFVQVSCSTFL